MILEVKGDFCRKLKGILEQHGRDEDCIEISLDSEYRYNPLHNDLDAYALAFSIASLLNNLFGRGKEPFADFRADDKNDPLYYARHTVAKAQSELQGRSGMHCPEPSEISHDAREIP